jgi:hypothetical protein
VRPCATRRRVAGTIPDEVIAFLNSLKFPVEKKGPTSTQLITEMSTRNLPEGKGRPDSA